MTKENSFIKKEMQVQIEKLTKNNEFNSQVIEELEKLLQLAKYGSVNHANKLVRLSTLKNYKLRLDEVIESYKSIIDLDSLISLGKLIDNVIEDSKTNLKASNESLNTVEVFSGDYIKQEILVKTYKDLVDLYSDAKSTLNKVKEDFNIQEKQKQEGTSANAPEPKKEPIKKEAK